MRISVVDTMSTTLPQRNLLPTIEFSKPDHTEKGLPQIIRRPAGAEWDPQSKQEYVRKRNAMYARRRVNKVKIQQVALEDRKTILESEKKRLKRDSERLELELARVLVSLADVTEAQTSNEATSSVAVARCGMDMKPLAR